MTPSTAFLPLPDAFAQHSQVQAQRSRAVVTVLGTLGTIAMVVLVTGVACFFPYFFGRWNGKASKEARR